MSSKSDNGSAFIAAEFAMLLAGWAVHQLFSPPRLPRYNGSCEAGIGSMKTRTHHRAASHGRPGDWTCDDAESARLEANETARPRGLHGPTPAEAWLARQPLTADERFAFAHAVGQHQVEARHEQGHALDAALDRTAQAAVARVALQRALVQCGLLHITSRQER